MTTLTHSAELADLASALHKAQGELEGAHKGSVNPHFRSKYADLASVWDAVRVPFARHGLSVIQVPCSEGARISVDTLLLHASGQWIRGEMSVQAKDDGPQAAGSCITYLRRYALAAFAGVAPEDDDAEGAEGRSKPRFAPVADVPKGFDEWVTDLTATADNGIDALKAAWDASRTDLRQYLTATNKAGWDALKARAVAARKAAV